MNRTLSLHGLVSPVCVCVCLRVCVRMCVHVFEFVRGDKKKGRVSVKCASVFSSFSASPFKD